jgi:hypothetical protein
MVNFDLAFSRTTSLINPRPFNRVRVVPSRETQIETSRPLANTSKMFIHTTQGTPVIKIRIAKVTAAR